MVICCHKNRTKCELKTTTTTSIFGYHFNLYASSWPTVYRKIWFHHLMHSHVLIKNPNTFWIRFEVCSVRARTPHECSNRHQMKLEIYQLQTTDTPCMVVCVCVVCYGHRTFQATHRTVAEADDASLFV